MIFAGVVFGLYSGDHFDGVQVLFNSATDFLQVLVLSFFFFFFFLFQERVLCVCVGVLLFSTLVLDIKYAIKITRYFTQGHCVCVCVWVCVCAWWGNFSMHVYKLVLFNAVEFWILTVFYFLLCVCVCLCAYSR